MINARFMYARPGNLFKEFIIEDNSQQVSSTGRVVNKHSGNGTKTLKAVSYTHLTLPTNREV